MQLNEFMAQNFNLNLSSPVRFTGLVDSRRAETISFLESPDYADDLNNNKNVVAVFIRKEHLSLLSQRIEPIVTNSPKSFFYDLHNAYYKNVIRYEKSCSAESATIHPTAFVSPVGVKLGENVKIGHNTTILSGVEIADNTTICPNCVLGYEGFQAYTDMMGIKRIVIHDGLVKIGCNVDIQATVTIAKGLMGRDTVICDECKLDSAVNISHGVHIGRKTLIASGTTVAGSANIGEDVWIGPGCSISNGLSIGNCAKVLIGSVVIGNIGAGEVVSGNFAQKHEEHLISQYRSTIR